MAACLALPMLAAVCWCRYACRTPITTWGRPGFGLLGCLTAGATSCCACCCCCCWADPMLGTPGGDRPASPPSSLGPPNDRPPAAPCTDNCAPLALPLLPSPPQLLLLLLLLLLLFLPSLLLLLPPL